MKVCVEERWDDCPEAGPKTRSKSDFCEQKPTLDILVVSGGKLKKLNENDFEFSMHCFQRVTLWA